MYNTANTAPTKRIYIKYVGALNVVCANKDQAAKVKKKTQKKCAQSRIRRPRHYNIGKTIH